MSFSSTTTELQTGIVGTLAYGADGDLLVESFALISATDIPPGRGVLYDTVNSTADTNACILPAGSVDNFLGVAYDDGNLPVEEAAYDAATYNRVPVLKRGQVWVLTSEAVTPANSVFLQHTANGASKPAGSFRTDNDGGNAAQVSGVRWLGVYTSGKAALAINQP